MQKGSNPLAERDLEPGEPAGGSGTRNGSGRRRFRALAYLVCLLWLALALALVSPGYFLASESSDPAAQTRQAFDKAKTEYQNQPQSPEAAWHFARAIFDLGDLSTNSTERAELAQQGIAACRQALTNHSDSAPLHYYLGLNQGQLARTRSLGALRLVDQMEQEFTRAIELDSSFDYAGAERTLGLLYRDAPAFASIGSRTKSRIHLQRALELAPRYPENRLIMVESEMKWGNRKAARQNLKLLEEAWPAAQVEFAGPAWAASWADWAPRLEKARKILDESTRIETPRH